MIIDEKGRIWRDDVDTEVDAHHKALGKYYNDKLKKYEEDMSSANDLDSATMLTSAEITAEAEANYGQLHN